MSQIPSLSGPALPLQGDDIDTDRIIPARFLKCVTFDGLGEHAFEDDRAQLQGRHPFDQPQYQGARVLVVNRNFGCGSSREHAPQAIARWGIQALVGESFAEIFFGNCVAMGIPCVTAASADVKALQGAIAAQPQTPVTVNLETMQATCGDLVIPVMMGDGPRQMFLSGTWDACGQLVAQSNEIKATAQKLPYLSWSGLTAS
ncbi:MAG: 3-isopropylmalate dehydratase small subunit [Synechococcales bacterium]|nr:3-isopropylmalate dehydratase small subunit [Synechococcales bacterium]